MIQSWIIILILRSKYNSLSGTSYIKLQKEFSLPRKGLINIRNIKDNECFKWCLVRYLRIRKVDRLSGDETNFIYIKFLVKIKDIQKVKKRKNSISISVFGYENKKKYPIYVSKNVLKKNMLILN